MDIFTCVVIIKFIRGCGLLLLPQLRRGLNTLKLQDCAVCADGSGLRTTGVSQEAEERRRDAFSHVRYVVFK